jgi:hypothetical protein
MRSFQFSNVVVLAVALAGCTAVLDVDRFREGQSVKDGALNTSPFLDLKFSMVAMKPHHAHMMEYRVIDANNMVQSRGIIDTLHASDVSLFVPRAIPKHNGPYRLDFYADQNASGGFDGLGSVVSNDHAWRIEPLQDFPEGEVPHVEGQVQVVFIHSTTFTNIDQWPSGTDNKPKDTEIPVRLTLKNLTEFKGKMLEVRVADKGTGHVVGLYRSQQVPSETITAVIPGAVDVGVEYEVSVYVDANGNGTYEAPSGGGDKGYKTSLVSTEQGLSVTFDPVDAKGDVDVGPP